MCFICWLFQDNTLLNITFCFKRKLFHPLSSWFCVRSSIVSWITSVLSRPFCHSLTHTSIHASSTHSSSAALLSFITSSSTVWTEGVTEWVRGVCWCVFVQPLSAFTLCVLSSGCWGRLGHLDQSAVALIWISQTLRTHDLPTPNTGICCRLIKRTSPVL